MKCAKTAGKRLAVKIFPNIQTFFSAELQADFDASTSELNNVSKKRSIQNIFSCIIILRHIKKMEAKYSPQLRYFWRFLTTSLPIAFTPASEILFTSQAEIIFPPN